MLLRKPLQRVRCTLTATAMQSTIVESAALGPGRLVAMVAGFLVTFGVRGLAIEYGWSLPVFRGSVTGDRWRGNRKRPE